jgi:hypothetical protein
MSESMRIILYNIYTTWVPSKLNINYTQVLHPLDLIRSFLDLVSISLNKVLNLSNMFI